MKAKKYLSLFLAISMTMSMGACGQNHESATGTEQTAIVSEADNMEQEKASEVAVSEEASSETSASEIEEVTESTKVEVVPTEAAETEVLATESSETEVIEFAESEPEITEPSETEIIEDNAMQKNSIAMLNYLMVITEKIEQSSNSKLYLEEVGNAMLNDFYPNAIDKRTQTQIGDLYRLVNNMRMIDIKRERLAYIYDQNKARAIMNAVPSPMSILNVVQAKNPLKAIASVVYVAVDSAKSYESATYANEMQYLKDGWDLDDDMDRKFQALNLDAFNYGQDIVDQYGIDGDLTLSQDMATALTEWENNDNISRRMEFLNNHKEEYKACGHYWLLLSRTCYDRKDYKGCVEAIEEYIDIQPRLFRRDVDMAKVLPLVIASLSDKYRGEELLEKELYYVQLLSSNVAANDWASRYYAALTYMDLYSRTKDKEYLQKAFNEAKTNVNEVKSTINNCNLIDYQLTNNKVYLADVKEATLSKKPSDDEKKEVKNYNKMLKEVRKTELAPVDNALLLNVKLMIDLAHELKLPKSQLDGLDEMIHGSGQPLFLVDSIDSQLWANKTVNLELPNVTFDGEKITIPSNYVCAQSAVSVSLNGKAVASNQNWSVEVVKRKGASAKDFLVTYVNKDIKNASFADGDVVTVNIYPYEDYFNPIEVSFKVKASKKLFVPKYSFERVN